ncbi:Kinesin light chain 4 (KLC 4) (Kinesin-like protein 8), partial [Durusdinium trenchii]
RKRTGRSLTESMAELRRLVEVIFKWKLGYGASLERQSYIEILQDIGVTLQEAQFLLQEYPEDSWIGVKDFLEIFFTSEAPKEEHSTSTPNQVKGDKASLKEYFEKGYKQGLVFDHDEYQHDAEDWCWVHTKLGVKVWQDAVDMTQASGAANIQCLFHYTSELGFKNIVDARKSVVEVFASLITTGEKANAWWGRGVYSVQKSPDEWPSIEALIDNNYRNMLKRDSDLRGREAAVEEYRSRVAFCIPILVDESIAYDVSKRQTPEMVEKGKPVGVNLAGKQLNEDGMPPRQCIVVRAERAEKVGNASAVLVESLRCRAEAIKEKLGSEHSEALKALSRLAIVLTARGDLAEAERLQRHVLEAYEAQRGKEDPETLRAVNGLAITLKFAGKQMDSLALFRQALAGREAQLGPVHVESLASVFNLGRALLDLGKLEEAELVCRRALAGCEAELGAMHPATLASLDSLGGLLSKQRKLEDAEVLFRRALTRTESQVGEMHPDTLTLANNLANVLLDQEKLEDAEALYRRALAGFEAELGAMHPETLFPVHGLAVSLRKQGKLEEAELLQRRALTGRQMQLGAMHPSTLASVGHLAKLLEVKGCLAEAEELYVREFQGLEELHGPDDEKTRRSRRRLKRFRRKHARGDLFETRSLAEVPRIDGYEASEATRVSPVYRHQNPFVKTSGGGSMARQHRSAWSKTYEKRPLQTMLWYQVNGMTLQEKDEFVALLNQATCQCLHEAIRVRLAKAASIHPWKEDEFDARIKEIFEMFQEPTDSAVMKASHLGDAMRMAQMNPTDSEVSKVMADLGNLESLTLPLLKRVMKDQIAQWSSRDQVQELFGCFEQFDPGKTCFLSRHTLMDVMRSGGNQFSEEMLEGMLEDVPSTSEGYDYRRIIAALLGPEVKKGEKSDGSDAEKAELEDQQEQQGASSEREEESETSTPVQDTKMKPTWERRRKRFWNRVRHKPAWERGTWRNFYLPLRFRCKVPRDEHFASLKDYFEKGYKQGLVFDHDEYQNDPKAWCWVHTKLGVKVWQDALDLTQASGASDVQCFFHYTTELGFKNITDLRKTVVEVFASLITRGEKANAWWGQGVYSVQRPPDEWPNIEALIDNNYRNMLKRDTERKGREAAVEEYRSRVAFCIPILVDESIAYDVSKRQTPEMVEQGNPVGVNLAGKQLNEDGMPPRQCIVIRPERAEEVGNANAVLVESLRCRAEAIRESLGSEHSDSLKASSRLARVLTARGDFEEAEPLHRRVLEAYEARNGAEDPETLTAVYNLAFTLGFAGKLAEAEALSRRALRGRERQLGLMHVDTLESVNNLGWVLKAQEKLGEADTLYRRALEGRKMQLGARHPDTLQSLNNLAGLAKNQGKLEEAELLYRRVLEGREVQLGRMHPTTLASVNNLAVLLQDEGELETAELHHRRALEGFELQLGSRHPHTLRSVWNLAKLLEAKGSLAEAEKLYLRELNAMKELRPDHEETEASRQNLQRFQQHLAQLRALGRAPAAHAEKAYGD